MTAVWLTAGNQHRLNPLDTVACVKIGNVQQMTPDKKY